MWKLWLDDQCRDPEVFARHTPFGFIGCSSTIEAMSEVLKRGVPAHMDLDHDLGDNDDALVFLRELESFMTPTTPIPSWAVHSANPIGRKRIESFMRSWEKSRNF